jgi:hypothetical protein
MFEILMFEMEKGRCGASARLSLDFIHSIERALSISMSKIDIVEHWHYMYTLCRVSDGDL